MKDFYKHQNENIPQHLKINKLEANETLELLKKHSRQLENYEQEELDFIKKKEKHLYFLRFILNHVGDSSSDLFYALIKINGRWYCFNDHRISVWENEIIFKMSNGHEEFAGFDTYSLYYSQGEPDQTATTRT